MKTEISSKQLDRLPKSVQLYIERISRERDNAIKALEDFKTEENIEDKLQNTNTLYRQILDEYPLPNNTSVTFKTDYGKVTAHVDKNIVNINIDDKIRHDSVIRLRASNSFDIIWTERE